MKKTVSILLLMFVFSLFFVGTVSASGRPPIGSCANGFELHEYMDQCSVNMPNHIGIVQDFNGDGLICMKVVASDLHVHTDNTFPLP